VNFVPFVVKKEENGYLHVPGCPPSKDDMLRYL
jgi:hypothetical protein